MSNVYNYPVKLENVVQHYPWGSHTLIPQLLGIQNKPATPFAELWMGSHPRGPSKLKISERSNDWIDLNSALNEAPGDFLGPRTDQFPDGLPFLFKVLAAAQPLSIQAHPNRQQAREGFAREDSAGIPIDAFERNYRDRNHKPEIICALTPFTAMCGFRSPSAIKEWYSSLVPKIYDKSICPKKNCTTPSKAEMRHDSAWLRQFFENIMNLNEDDQKKLIETLYSWAEDSKNEYKEAELIKTFYDQHGVNVGVQAPLFLNIVELSPGEALYQPAGVLHAYVQGMGVELMANSDNVLRGGLTKKHVDVPELLNILSFEPRPADILKGQQLNSHLLHYPVPIDEFELQHYRSDQEHIFTKSERTSIEIGICTHGEFQLKTKDNQEPLSIVRGESFVVPYAAGSYTLYGRGEIYLATIPSDSTTSANGSTGVSG